MRGKVYEQRSNHHYSLATDSLQQSMETLHSLGYHAREIAFGPVQKVRVAFASRPQEATIEILCNVDMNDPTHHVISKTGNGLYRICYEPDNLDETMLKLRHEGFLLMLVFEIWGDRHWFSRSSRCENLNRGIGDAVDEIRVCH